MERRGVYPAGKASVKKAAALALFEKDEEILRRLRSIKAVKSPLPMRLAMAALAGIFLLMATSGALWAWIGAAFFMMSLAGADAGLACLCGAIAAGISYFGVLASRPPTGVFWAHFIFQTGAGALIGALVSEMSRKLPPTVFAFLAALLPAGLEHLGSFAAGGNLTSIALTQYLHPVIVKMARLGGLSGVTYVIFVLGGAAAMSVRYVRETQILVRSTLPPVGFVLLALVYGAISSSSQDSQVIAVAFSPRSSLPKLLELSAKEEYQPQQWQEYTARVSERIQRMSGKSLGTTAMSRVEQSVTTQLLVLPEASLYFDTETSQEFLKKLAGIATNTRAACVVGYYDVDAMKSTLAMSDGIRDARKGYSRRRYLPGTDDVFAINQIASPGNEKPGVLSTPHGKFAALLSLDANYFSNFKAAASAGAELVAVAAYDDKLVPQVSMRLLVYNAALSGLAVVRSARNGMLAAIGPDGEIIKKQQTFEKADAEIVAHVPKGKGKTFFLVFGNAFAWLAILVGLGAGLYASTLEEHRLHAPRPTTPREKPSAGGISYKTRGGMQKL